MPRQQKENLTLVISSGKRLANLVNDILDYEKLKHGDLHLNKQSIDIRQVIPAALEVSKYLSLPKPITMVSKLPDTLPPIETDENRFTQIIYNLLGNAIKFTEQGTITISAKRPALKALEYLLKQFPNIEIIGAFTDVEQAMQRIRNNPIDLLFLDIDMPKQSGIAAAKKVLTIGKILYYDKANVTELFRKQSIEKILGMEMNSFAGRTILGVALTLYYLQSISSIQDE